MFIGYLKLVLHIPNSLSLKDKRRIIKSIKTRIRNNFNIAVGEKPSDKWQICELACVCINYEKHYAEELIAKVENFIRIFSEVQLLEVEKQIL